MTAHPGYGHVLPVVGLGTVLAERGHEVHVATGPRFVPVVERAGLAAVPTGLDWSQSDAGAVHPGRMLFAEAPLPFLADLEPLARSLRPDVIVREETETAAAAVGEALDIPAVTLGIGGSLVASAFRGRLGAVLSALRHALDLPDDPQLGFLHRYLYLDPYPESWVPQDRRPAGMTRPAGVGPTPRVFGDAAPVPPVDVYATLGTVHHREPGLVAVILDALRRVGRPALVALGPGADLRGLDVPANVTVRSVVPQDEVLAGCRAVLAHGGTGTALGALRHGRPLVLVPLDANQGWTAQLAERAGVARVLLGEDPTPTGSSGRRADAASIRVDHVVDALEDVLSGEAYRRRAQADGAHLRSVWEERLAAKAIETVAATRAPIDRRA